MAVAQPGGPYGNGDHRCCEAAQTEHKEVNVRQLGLLEVAGAPYRDRNNDQGLADRGQKLLVRRFPPASNDTAAALPMGEADVKNEHQEKHRGKYLELDTALSL
jgi:hypothetical protein